VVCLNSERFEAERELCRRRGIEFHYIPMPEDGTGRAEQFAEAVDILRSANHHPVLVHCQAGVARTGAVVALYRIWEQHWTFDRAVDELASFERNGICQPALRRCLSEIVECVARAN
jgi:protein tyrosine/serine phosphatase